jgi:ABC-type branched-subunit amino acid transport system substrate-binding protein
VRARRQWRLFNAEPAVVRITALGSVLVLLIGLMAVAGHSSSHKGVQGLATRGRTSLGLNVPGGAASASSDASSSAAAASGGPNAVAGGGPGSGDGSQPGNGFAPDGSALTASDRGVTATKIKVVFPVADLGPIGQTTGLTSDEDEPTAITAFVNDINHNGGINGRLIDPEIVKYNPLNDSDMRADCKDWTESQEVFAVVDSYGWHDDHQLCITQEGKTPLISKWTSVTDWTDRGQPNLWWTGPDQVQVIDDLVAYWKDLLAHQKYAVIAGDRESDQLALGYLKQSLQRAGLPQPYSFDSIPFTDQAAAAVIPAIVTKYHANNVRVVLPLVSFLSLLQFVQQEDSQYQGQRTDNPATLETPPQMLLSDYESEIQAMLGLTEAKYKKELQNTVGPTTFRLGDNEDPTGYTPLGEHCFEAFKVQDPTFSNNLEGPGAALTWCQNIYLFAKAAQMAGNQLTRAGFDGAMRQIQGFGGSVNPDLTFGVDPYVYSGPHLYRIVEIHVNDDHKCPPKATPGEQGSCWLIQQDFQPALQT